MGGYGMAGHGAKQPLIGQLSSVVLDVPGAELLAPEIIA